jgi:hypothetical protein
VRRFTLLGVTSGLWFGAATTLAGAALAGAISLALNRQQIKDAREQRAEEDRRNRRRRREDRRFEAYADFATQARAYRDAIRPLVAAPVSQELIEKLDELARLVNTASAFVFLIVESIPTYDTCRSIVMLIGNIQAGLHSAGPGQQRSQWAEANNNLANLLREFQVAVRDELEVIGIDRSVILDRTLESKGIGHGWTDEESRGEERQG